MPHGTRSVSARKKDLAGASPGLRSGFDRAGDPERPLALELMQGPAECCELFILPGESEHAPHRACPGVGRGGPSETHHSAAPG